MIDKIFIGTVKKECDINFVSGERLYLDRHNWDCNWYWGFGYVGNGHMHTHFNSTFISGTGNSLLCSEIFVKPVFSDHNWWVIRDLFVQAYALKESAEVYYHGGYQTSLKGITDLIQNDVMVDRLNSDLEKVLNTLWQFMLDSRRK